MPNRLDAKWIREINGCLTFCGVYEAYYKDLAKDWKAESTRDKYDNYYNETILPNLPDHDNKKISDYTRDDYELAIQSIIDKGQQRNSNEYIPYADSTIQRYRYLIGIVVDVAANNGLCDNVLWGSCFNLKEDPSSDDLEKERVKLKKSLTPEEDLDVATHLLSDPMQRGENMGLLLMYALGLRNNEACGVDFGDIKPLTIAPHVKCLWVYKSTTIGSNIVKTSGKTGNADRVIPIPDYLESFINERRDQLLKIITFPCGNYNSIDELPIACLGNDYLIRAGAHNLTSAGREMFRIIRMDSDKLAFIDYTLRDKTLVSELKESDPTAYLLRRNFATHLSILGFAESDIEYIIGHDIVDPYETRNEYVNEDRLLEIKKKIDHRPILTPIKKQQCTLDEKLLPQGNAVSLDNYGPQNYRFLLPKGSLLMHIKSKEPIDDLKLRLHSSNQISRRVFKFSFPDTQDRTLDILKQYHEVYPYRKKK